MNTDSLDRPGPERAPDLRAAAQDDVWLIAGYLRGTVEARLPAIMKIIGVAHEDGDGRRIVITFASGARVRIVVEALE